MFDISLITQQCIAFFLPRQCLLCHTTLKPPYTLSHFACANCLSDLPHTTNACITCGNYLANPIRMICGACQTQPPPFTRLFSLYPYEPPISTLIMRLKFQQSLQYAPFFAEQLAKRISTQWYQGYQAALPQLIIPIPLHSKRLRERGFNQALEIAKPLAKELHLPLQYQALIRDKLTTPQSGLKAALRKKNVSHAFQSQHDFSRQRIALLDDVVTTATTVREAAKVLREKGATSIDVWCIARR